MKRIHFICLFVISLIWTLNAAAQKETKEQLIVPLSETGKPFKLDVNLIMGSISVNSYEGKDVIILASSEGNNNEEKENRNGMHRISSNNKLDITAEQKNNHISVSTGLFNLPVNLVIKVPKSFVTLKISTISEGEISATNINGELEVSNVSGGIKLSNISGSVVANTVSGDVMVTFISIDPKAAMAFTTLSGDVDVTFPSSLKADVKLKSDQGEIYTDFKVESKQSNRSTTSSQNGLYKITIGDWINGKINGGGPQLMMKNMTGNIYIRMRK